MSGKRLPILAACLLLTACAVGEDYHKPETNLSAVWQSLGSADPNVPSEKKTALNISQMSFAATPDWWERFYDPALSQLMEKARANNNDLKVALARIGEARGNARIAGAALLPQVSASGSIGRTGALRTTATPADTVRQIGVNATWDIDIFGGDQRSIEAALDEVQATQADKDKVLLSLITDVATNYVQLRSLQQQRALTISNLKMQQDTLNVTTEQRKQGAISDLEVARATAQVESTNARLPQIDTATVAALNRLSVLTGVAPTGIDQSLVAIKPIPSVPSNIVVAMPVRAMEDRPDVQAAERRLGEATALSGASLANLYPKISLQAFFGSQFSQVYGYSTPANATVNALMPLLDWGRIHGQIDAANARQQEAYATYQQTILLALEQIENALTAYINEQLRLHTLDSAAQEQRKAAEVASEQYKVGATTQLDLLTAENSQLDAENEVTLSRAALAIDLVQLYTALGQTYQPDSNIALTETPAQADVNERAEPNLLDSVMQNWFGN